LTVQKNIDRLAFLTSRKKAFPHGPTMVFASILNDNPGTFNQWRA